MTYHFHNDSDYLDEFEFLDDTKSRNARRSKRPAAYLDDTPVPARTRKQRPRPPRTEHDQAFKCGHCKQFIGAPISGGRHRNHCPNCLYSKHVDHRMPGDRRSDCGSLMAPVGVMSRRNGEQMILHRCLGCGKEAPNRIAADDDPITLLHIPPAPRADRISPVHPPEFAAMPIYIAESDEEWSA